MLFFQFIVFLLDILHAFSIAKLSGAAYTATSLNANPNANDVLVYNGRGACGVHEIIAPLRAKLQDYNVRSISTKELLEGNWMGSAALFVLPGGIATPYSEDLEASGGTDLIREYVYEGGSFVGMFAI
jgi:hypothetical protein